MKFKYFILLALSTISMNTFAFVYANSYALEATGKVGESVKLNSKHEVMIHNQAPIYRQYTYVYTLKLDGVQIAQFMKTIDLMKNADFKDTYYLTGNVTKLKAGHYVIQAETRIVSKVNAICATGNRLTITN